MNFCGDVWIFGVGTYVCPKVTLYLEEESQIEDRLGILMQIQLEDDLENSYVWWKGNYGFTVKSTYALLWELMLLSLCNSFISIQICIMDWVTFILFINSNLFVYTKIILQTNFVIVQNCCSPLNIFSFINYMKS